MEIKVLDIDYEKVIAALEEMGAKKVFDDERIISYFQRSDDQGAPFLKLTAEGDKLKLASQNLETHEEIKLFVSRKEECVALLASLRYGQITEVRARRISYELGDDDFDIDLFSEIPPFLEIDAPSQNDDLTGLLRKLNINDNERGVLTTPEIHQKYDVDYFEVYRV